MARTLASVLLSSFTSVHSRAQDPPKRVVHVFVALVDNESQGIVPVPTRLGNGVDPAHNVYWGAAAGVKTLFVRSSDLALLNCGQGLQPAILEHCVFVHRGRRLI